MTKSPEERGAEWLKSGNIGASSKTIYNFFISGPPNDPAYPHDSADFGRCAALLEAVPEWEKRLSEMAAIGGMEGEIWAALAEVWIALATYHAAEDFDHLNQRLKEIIEPIEKASGRVFAVGKNAKVTLPKSMATDRPAGPGHNSGDEPEPKDVGGVAGARLRAFLDRVERLEEEKSGIAEDIKDIFAEAKGVGFDVKTMRRILKLRKMDSQKRQEEEEILDLYLSAIGMA